MFHVHFHGCKIRSLFRGGEMRQDGGWGGKVPRDEVVFHVSEGARKGPAMFFALTFVGGF